MTRSKGDTMPDVHQGDSLSWGDSLFLYLEREGQPLNIASVSDFEGVISLKECTAWIESRLPLIPHFRQHVVPPPFNVGLPTWEFDPKFDIRNHIREVKLRRGTESAFKAAAAKVLSATMNRDWPLWDLTLLHGLDGNRTGIVIRAHHALADGIAGVGLMSVLLGNDASVPPAPPRTEPFKAPVARDSGALFLDGLLRSYSSVVDRLLKVQSEVLGAAQRAVGSSGAGTDPARVADAASAAFPGLVDMLTEMATPAERLPFNRVCRGPQHIAWADFAMPEVKAIKNSLGVTVNDVFLTVLTSALRRYAELHHVRLKGRSLRIIVPINVRGDDPTELGNRITFLPLNLPLDVRDPRKLIAVIQQKMGYFKNVRAAALVELAGTLAGTIPPALQAMAGPIASQLPLSVCNIICTNVPGPQIPMYLLGHRLLRWYPYVPIGGEMGINCAVVSYDGRAYFGFTGDVHAAPDVARLEEFMKASFAELKASVEVPSAPTKPKRPRAVSAPKHKMTRKRRKPGPAYSVTATQSEPAEQEEVLEKVGS
jgi:diacylglycerol O-acyltransferase